MTVTRPWNGGAHHRLHCRQRDNPCSTRNKWSLFRVDIVGRLSHLSSPSCMRLMRNVSTLEPNTFQWVSKDSRILEFTIFSEHDFSCGVRLSNSGRFREEISYLVIAGIIRRWTLWMADGDKGF
ncbi:hypothetical protein AB1N83_014191 [Pleurotus pulmonarius]